MASGLPWFFTSTMLRFRAYFIMSRSYATTPCPFPRLVRRSFSLPQTLQLGLRYTKPNIWNYVDEVADSFQPLNYMIYLIREWSLLQARRIRHHHQWRVNPGSTSCSMCIPCFQVLVHPFANVADWVCSQHKRRRDLSPNWLHGTALSTPLSRILATLSCDRRLRSACCPCGTTLL